MAPEHQEMTKEVSDQQTQSGYANYDGSLNLAELKSVKYVTSQQTVKDVYNLAKPLYEKAKSYLIVKLFTLWFEIVVMNTWFIVHRVPWPKFIVNFIHKVDHTAEWIIESIHRKLEWWWDKTSVRLMWARESMSNGTYTVAPFIEYLLKLAIKRALYYIELALAFKNSCQRMVLRVFSLQSITREWNFSEQNGKSEEPSCHSKLSEEEPSEGGCQSDTSDISLLTENVASHADKEGNVYNRFQTSATVEGKLRDVLQKRVEDRLLLMRRNSIKISQNIATFAWNVVEPKIRPAYIVLYGWILEKLKEYEIYEMYEAIRVELSTRSILMKPFILYKELLFVALKLTNKITRGKKSRRRRSRSESMRRRMAPRPLPKDPVRPGDLKQSSEPVKSESFQLCDPIKEAEEEDAKNMDSGCPNEDLTDGVDSVKSDQINESSEATVDVRTEQRMVNETAKQEEGKDSKLEDEENCRTTGTEDQSDDHSEAAEVKLAPTSMGKKRSKKRVTIQ